MSIPVSPTESWREANADEVKARFADALDPIPTITIGDITLMPHQADAVLRLRAALREFHGALLADDVGLGKTFVALALAAQHRIAHVIAPAALLPMWRDAIARAASANVVLHSLHVFSRRAPAHPPRAKPSAALVIIDEAHHLRSTNTRRYRSVAEFVAHQRVLLLSATPLHNSARELQHLLALFAGHRTDLLQPHVLSRLIVRRTDAPERAMPTVRTHQPHDVPHDKATLNAILALPAPLAAHNGAVAGALIRLGLLRAWCSSDAALAHALTRRMLRGEALRQALLAGRHPTEAELRTWLVGDHEVQLAFPELLAQATPETGPLLDILERHLSALGTLRAQHRHIARADAARAQHLREILSEHPDTPVVAFSQFSQTVHALFRALSDIAGVGALSHSRARIASGSTTRQQMLHDFAPIAHGRPPPPSHRRVRLLLTTDLLSEGVNLQDAGVVVHLDLPWTDAIRAQRVGRAVRLGSLHTEVHVMQLGPPSGSERVLRLTERLARKAQVAERLVGASRHARVSDTCPKDALLRETGAGTSPSSAADAASFVLRVFRMWRHGPAVAGPSVSTPVTSSNQPIVAKVPATQRGGIALLVSHSRIAPAWRVLAWLDDAAPSEAVEDVRRAIMAMHASVRREPCATPVTTSRTAGRVRYASRSIARWLQREEEARLFGARAAATSAEQRLATKRLAAVTRTISALERTAWVDDINAAQRAIYAARASATQRELAVWADSVRCHDRVLDWLQACPLTRLRPVLDSADVPLRHAADAPEETEGGEEREPSRFHVAAVLLLEPLSALDLP